MARAIFAFPNWVDSTFYSVSFTGGSWEVDLPLTNLVDPILQNVARSTDASNPSTQFVINMGAPRNVLVVAIPGSNLSQDATYRIRGYTDAGLTINVFDSGILPVWGIVFPWESLAFEDPSFWTGQTSPESVSNYPQPIIATMPDYVDINAQYWKIEFDDTTNTDGYVELNRLFIAGAYQPSINIQYGAQLGWSTSTVSEESLGGVLFFDERPTRRNLKVNLNVIPLQEAMNNLFEAYRAQGISRQIFFIYDPEDTANLARRSFLCYFVNIQNNPVVEDNYLLTQQQVELLEVI